MQSCPTTLQTDGCCSSTQCSVSRWPLSHDLSLLPLKPPTLTSPPTQATGGSAMQAIEVLQQHGVPAERILFLNLVSCPEGLNNVYKKCVSIPSPPHYCSQPFVPADFPKSASSAPGWTRASTSETTFSQAWATLATAIWAHEPRSNRLETAHKERANTAHLRSSFPLPDAGKKDPLTCNLIHLHPRSAP